MNKAECFDSIQSMRDLTKLLMFVDELAADFNMEPLDVLQEMHDILDEMVRQEQ